MNELMINTPNNNALPHPNNDSMLTQFMISFC